MVAFSAVDGLHRLHGEYIVRVPRGIWQIGRWRFEHLAPRCVFSLDAMVFTGVRPWSLMQLDFVCAPLQDLATQAWYLYLGSECVR